MRRWIPTRGSVFSGLRGRNLSGLRCFSIAVNNVERVSFRTGSSGFATIDLHNIAKVPSPGPLLIYLPPYSTAFSDRPAELPRFIQRWPTAVINYRWVGYPPSEDTATHSSKSDTDPAENEDEDEMSHLAWPSPIHDTARAYEWIVENLGPANYTRRDIYVYGSYLGASLAVSLTLTETHPHARMGIRGCVAYNGIYNWTTFLPDHRINEKPQHQSRNILEEILGHPAEDPEFQELKQHREALFTKPGYLFDPFASPCLFFHTPGIFVPPDFNSTALSPAELLPEDLALLPDDAPELFMPTKSPRKSTLIFPPRKSTLKIPEALLLHSSPPQMPPSLWRRRQRRKKIAQNNFRTQAEDLAGLMRRSIDKVELKERSRWDESDSWDEEAARRVQLQNVGLGKGGFELDSKGEELAAAWLEDHMGNPYSK
ncbi:uncharacterized protein GGS22DRAFT_154788 [Annulohypoxylon maeteangense]|uniref:uncharacterized protein n=1 Tax=Annulohypoxylon maeteangense TaxID=1927788 RepID=UPI0020073FA5|nr:uncharacterized protein GGS22DRAFT_154788 [Annulohypoxylon maeteangense]KAI0888004.1 hypothetical protein GGS22DRAFT_154788 [Annulohypoxylon maeteangense]